MNFGLMGEHAAEKISPLPADFDFYKWEVFPKGGCQMPSYLLLSGVSAPLLTRGKNKGKRNWKKRDKATENIVMVMHDEHERWLVEWEAKTGKCKECEGKGETWDGWNIETGTKMKTCTKCQGTGKAKP